MKMWKSLCVAIGLMVVLVGNISANCNKQKQPGKLGESASATFELPKIPAKGKAFSFDDPDPQRTLESVPYTITPTAKSVFQIGVSGRLSPSRAAAFHQGILKLLTASMCRPGDVAVIWDAETLNRIALFRNSDRVQSCDLKWVKFKVSENQGEIAKLNLHFQKMKEAQHTGIADLNVPRLVNFLGQEFHEYPDYPNRILVLFGSAIYVDPNDKQTSFLNSYPTVGMLRAPLSPFSTSDRAWYLGNTVTHFVVNEEDFRNGLHKNGLRSFWAAYLLSQGSPLLTFSPDPEVSERVLNPKLPVIPAYVDDLTPGFISVEPRQVGLFDALKNARPAVPSALSRGTLVLGLMWDDPAVDLDLHVGFVGKQGRLSFHEPNASFGTLRKHPGTGWEEVHFTGEVVPKDVQVWVNFFSGTAPTSGMRGELRVAYGGQLFRFPVTFPPAARHGNLGKAESRPHWVAVDIGRIVSGRGDS